MGGSNARRIGFTKRKRGTALAKSIRHYTFTSFFANILYVECELPNGKKAIGSKWVFKLKRIPGEKDRFKARCVARGYSQRHGIDYGETFSPVIRYESIRILLALAAIKNLYMKQCDVKTAFLYGNLDEEIYLEPPPGFNSGKFWTLKKSLYGLKQAPRCWNSTFHDFLMKYNLKQNTADQCVYHSKVNEFDLFFGLYVDDGIILSQSECIIDEFLNEMKERFKIKISSPNYFVGMEIEQDAISKDIRIHQSTYIENILNKYKLQEIAELSIPSDPNVQLTRHEGENINVPYRQVVGSLMFLACVTRPDIAFAVNQVSRYLERHGKEHWNAVLRILKYLKQTKEFGITYKASENFDPIGYCDADYAGDPDNRRSTSGVIFTMCKGPVIWSSRRQPIVSLSTTEAEYIAACDGTKEAIWIKRFVSDIGHKTGPMLVYCDNQGAIKLMKNSEYHRRTKHIDVRFHFIREKINEGIVEIAYVRTDQQLADLLTKPLPRTRFYILCDQLNIN